MARSEAPTKRRQPIAPRRGGRRPSAPYPKGWRIFIRPSITRLSPSPTRPERRRVGERGNVGFKGSRKGTPFAAQLAAEAAAKRAIDAGMRAVQVFVKGGCGSGVGAALAPSGGIHDQLDQGCDADSAQRVSATQAKKGLKDTYIRCDATRSAGGPARVGSAGPGGSAAWLVTERQYAGFAGVKD